MKEYKTVSVETNQGWGGAKGSANVLNGVQTPAPQGGSPAKLPITITN